MGTDAAWKYAATPVPEYFFKGRPLQTYARTSGACLEIQLAAKSDAPEYRYQYVALSAYCQAFFSTMFAQKLDIRIIHGYMQGARLSHGRSAFM